MKKGDIAVMVAILLLAAIWIFASQEGSMASIYVNGKLYKKLPLKEDAAITVKSEFGENTVVIEDGEVFVANSNCENKHCERQKISAASRSLVCLPNRLSVIVEGKKADKEADVII